MGMGAQAPQRLGVRGGPRPLSSMLREILNGKHTNLAQSNHLVAHTPRKGMVWKVPQS